MFILFDSFSSPVNRIVFLISLLVASTGIPHFIVLLGYCIFLKNKLKVYGNPVPNQFISAMHPTTFANFKSLSHFGNCYTISNFSINSTIFVMVICDQ